MNQFPSISERLAGLGFYMTPVMCEMPSAAPRYYSSAVVSIARKAFSASPPLVG